MGIAYSDKPIAYSTVRSDTGAHLQADLDAILLFVGWTHTTITGGFKYTITSPQGLQAKLKIWDSGAIQFGLHFLTVQALTMSEGAQSLPLAIGYGKVGHTSYEVVAGICQVFLAEPLLSDDGASFRFAFGIPSVTNPTTTECAASAGTQTTSSAWWINGCTSVGGTNSFTDFRNSRFCITPYSFCHNDIVFSPSNNSDDGYSGALRIFPLTPTTDVDSYYRGYPKVAKYSSGDPMYIDAFVGWQYQIHGQIWDALLATYEQTLDSLISLTQVDDAGGTRTATFIAWNYQIFINIVGSTLGTGTHFATLYLLKGNGPGYFTKGVSNYAY